MSVVLIFFVFLFGFVLYVDFDFVLVDGVDGLFVM